MVTVRSRKGARGEKPSAVATALHSSRMPSRKSLPPGAARMMPSGARIRLVEAAIEARNVHFSHMSCSTFSLATEPKLPLRKISATARTRSVILPSRSPKVSDCIGCSCTTSRLSLSVTAIAQRPPSTRSRPNFPSSTSSCSMPLSSGMIEVSAPTAGAKDLIASSRSNALQLNSTTSNFSFRTSACTVGGFFKMTSPFGLLITRPAEASSAARRGRTRNVMSRPACSILPPKYPPMAPAPTTRTRIVEILFCWMGEMASSEWRIGIRNSHSLFATLYSLAATLPLFPKRADFHLKSPGAARLLVELPVRGGDGGRRHQQIRVVQRLLAPELFASLPHPGGIDSGIDDQMRDMDVFRSQFPRHRLRHRAQAEFCAGECRIAAATAKRGGGAGEEDAALAARQHQARRFAACDKAGPAGHFPDFSEHTIGGLQNREVDVGADVENADLERRVPVGVVEERRRLLLFPRIERAAEDRAAGRFDFLHQRLELLAVAPSGEHGKTFGGEFLDDLGADVVAGADHRDGGIAFFHGLLSLPSLRAKRSNPEGPS